MAEQPIKPNQPSGTLQPAEQPTAKESITKPAIDSESTERHITGLTVVINITNSPVPAGEHLRFTVTSYLMSTLVSPDRHILQFIKKHLILTPTNGSREVQPDVQLRIAQGGSAAIGELETSELREGTNYTLKGEEGILFVSKNGKGDNNGVEFNVNPAAERLCETNVNLQRTVSHPTDDQSLWVAIRNSTNAISFDRYQQFIELVFDGETYGTNGAFVKEIIKIPQYGFAAPLSKLNIYGPYAYTVLKLATQAFLTLQCGLKPHVGKSFESLSPDLSDFLDRRSLIDLEDEEIRLGRHVNHHKLKEKLSDYLGDNRALPYLDRIVGALLTVGPGEHHHHPDEPHIKERLPYYYGILQHRATRPSLIELIWSYWLEEGMLAQTMNAIALRFQNQRSGPNDPLAELELDPLRPLNNMIWGFVQDRYNQLSVSRRASEYDHQYGLRLVGRAVPELNSADSRSKFIEAFHNLLYRTAVFYREDSDTTVHADAFPLLNALKDVHLLLAEGAHNQYGDLPWTARAEMLSQQWMLARPEMREFLRGRYMVPYQEKWMGAVDSMKKLQGWTDTTVSHFHELAVDGERILLSIRFGDWSDLNLTEYNAKNWARYWKPEIQRYIYGYRAATGVDLMADVVDTREAEMRYLQPSALLQRRLASQTRPPAALAAAPRRQAIAAPAGQGYAALPRPQQTSRVSRLRAIKYEQGE